MRVYRKKGGKLIKYSSKRISNNLKPSQQDDGSSKQGALAVGSSTEQHGGPATGSSTMTRSKKRFLDNANGASPHLPADVYTCDGKVSTEQ